MFNKRFTVTVIVILLSLIATPGIGWEHDAPVKVASAQAATNSQVCPN